MVEGLRSKFRRLEGNIKLIVGVGLAVYLIALAIYVGISHLIHHAITNNGLVFWTALGTVIAAAFASIYGSDRAFDLNRQKELDAQKKLNLEAGRWAMVVISANLNSWTREASGNDLLSTIVNTSHKPITRFRNGSRGL